MAINLDAQNRLLGEAERALRSSPGGRRESERIFLERLLRELGGDLPAGRPSPADLFRAVLHDRPWMPSARLEVLALPSQRLRGSVRAGDWIVRATAGTGDVEHIAVLASGEMLTQSMLAAEGVAAESAQAGYYGVVIEGRAFPHDRGRPFARRLLDSRGRVPPHTMILRPKHPDMDAVEDFSPGTLQEEDPQESDPDTNPLADWVADRDSLILIAGDDKLFIVPSASIGAIVPPARLRNIDWRQVAVEQDLGPLPWSVSIPPRARSSQPCWGQSAPLCRILPSTAVGNCIWPWLGQPRQRKG